MLSEASPTFESWLYLAFQCCRGQLAESAQTLTQRSFNRAQVVLLVIDALEASQKSGVTRREMTLASNVIGEGRALIVLLNKYDAVPEHLKLGVSEHYDSSLLK